MAKMDKQIRKDMLYKFYSWARRDGWPPYPSQALKEFEEEKSHRKQANRYAKENPDLTGFITFPMSRTGGWWFYRIDKGKASDASAFSMFLEVDQGLLNWWDY